MRRGTQMEMDTEYSPAFDRERAATYRLFSGLLLNEVTEQFLKQVAICPPIREGLLGEYLVSLESTDLETERRELAADFAALLLNMSAQPVMVYESVYTSPLHMMMQEPRDQVIAEYASRGFSVTPELKLPEDHISFELEFMGLLCDQEANYQSECDAVSLASCRMAEERFLRDHLLKWAFEFCDDLEKKARTKFYKGLAESLKQFLLLEMDDFGIEHI